MTATAADLRAAGWAPSYASDGAGGAWIRQYENKADRRLVLHTYSIGYDQPTRECLYVPEIDRMLERDDWDGAQEALQELGEPETSP